MSIDYSVYLTNGVKLLDLVPMRVDNTTSLSLQGDQVVPRYGQLLPSNLVHLLEHFADKTPPLHPLVGQIWFNTTSLACEVWNGKAWTGVTGGGGSGGPTGPTGPTVPPPIVSGSTQAPPANNYYSVALANLIQALANVGLIINQTTA